MRKCSRVIVFGSIFLSLSVLLAGCSGSKSEDEKDDSDKKPKSATGHGGGFIMVHGGSGSHVGGSCAPSRVGMAGVARGGFGHSGVAHGAGA
jgi:hypothetical protein